MKHYKLQEIPEENVTDLFARRFFTGKQITLAFLNMKKGCVVPEHYHESEQFSHILTGSMRFIIGGDELILRAGEVVEIPSNVPHSAEVLDPARLGRRHR
jgi:unsaturated pyranuronate lyase